MKWKDAFESKGLKVILTKTKVMVSGLKEEIIKSKPNPRAKCSQRVIANSVLCTKYGKWVHGRCAKIKRVTSILAKGFICERCVKAMKGIVKPSEELPFYDQVELVKNFLLGKQIKC